MRDIKINEEILCKAEALSKISLDSEERQKLGSQMEELLSYVKLLGEVDTENVEPLVHVRDVNNLMREDVICETNDNAILMNAPKAADNQFVVPKTV